MNTNEIITPDHVRWVLGIEDWEHEKYCDNAFRLEGEEAYALAVDNNFVKFEHCCECYYEGLKEIEGSTYLLEEPEVWFSIHHIIYLAIEKCAAEGWKINDSATNERIEVNHPEEGEFETFDFCRYPSRFHAQLAAIAWVYGKIQEGK